MARKNPHKKAELLQGTLDMLILKSLANGRSLHGYAVAQWIQATTDEALKIEEGSLYPALHRMKRRGWVESEPSSKVLSAHGIRQDSIDAGSSRLARHGSGDHACPER
jgi:hypothetical protein